MNNNYNCTQLNPDSNFERHVYHRDMFAHYLRWSHVLKRAKINQNILDFGSGSGNLLEVFYRNKFKCKEYLGLEYRKQTVKLANEKFKMIPWAQFKVADLTTKLPWAFYSPKSGDWDYIISFEVIEHIGKKNIHKFLATAHLLMGKNTKFIISTPIFDPQVGAAENHIIDGVVGELTYKEMKSALEKAGFKIEEQYGTFASIKDYKKFMNHWQKEMFDHLQKYYDSNLVSVIMAPFFPQFSRNCLWVCSK